MIVALDAGALLEVLFRSDAGWDVERAIESADVVSAPELIDAEVLHRLLAMHQRRQLTDDELERTVTDLRDAPIERVAHVPLLAAAARLGRALSGYDALYVAVADALGATLWTTDARLARTATQQAGVRVECVGSSGR